MTLLCELHSRAARNWSKFDAYLEIILSFGIHSAQEIEDEGDSMRGGPSHDPNGEAYQIGLEIFFQSKYLRLFGDFVL